MNTAEWIEESELSFDFADLKQEAYEKLVGDADTDDSTDEAINAVLDARGMRKMFSDGYLFDADCARADFADAVLAGMTAWDNETVDVMAVEYYSQELDEAGRKEYRAGTLGLSAGTRSDLDRIDAGGKALCLS
jgi:hypothetical protein